MKHHKKSVMKPTPKNINQFQSKILDWYDQNKRNLIFRQTKNPYHIWLSEIMLQQTTVAVVEDYYRRFLSKFPTIHSVASARDEDLLSAWQGLGYYSRVRNFKSACIQILKEHKGRVPDNFTDLLTLKGIGHYTAAAIASICFKQPHAVVDGNVKRVLARLFYFREEMNSKKAHVFFNETAQSLLAKEHAGDFNQAMMELGATICRPQKPMCLLCPVNNFCIAQKYSPENIPVKNKKTYIAVEYASLLLTDGVKVILKKPTQNNLIQNMWELPSLYHKNDVSYLETWQKEFKELKINKTLQLSSIKHSITNKKITNLVFTHPLLQNFNKNIYEIVALETLTTLPVNTITKKILKSL